MWLLVKILGVLVVLLAAGIGYVWQRMFMPGPLPQLQEEWWGPGQPRNVPDTITPFQVKVPPQVIQDLNARLDRWTKPTKPLEGAQFTYGFNTDYLKEVVKFWRNEYDWSKREAFLNSLPQYKTNVAGLNLHFIHAKPKAVPAGTRVLPLLIMHGWPGSVRELYSVIPMLTEVRKGQNFVFEVIAPSLPGYGFSDGAARPGLGSAQIAVVMRQLMQRLGFQQFYIQAGDWGANIAANMATLFPSNVLGLHSNMCVTITHPRSLIMEIVGQFYPSLIVEPEYQDRIYPLSARFAYLVEMSGYFHQQATKPDTVGVGLRDSPVGLAAYILEKFSGGTDRKFKQLPDGGLTKKFTLTDLLDNVMIYWVTDSITTSMRLYAETFSSSHLKLGVDKIPTNVPTACMAAPNEVVYNSKAQLLVKFPQLVQYTHPPRGGHFIAFEEPQILADDVWDAIGKILARQRPASS